MVFSRTSESATRVLAAPVDVVLQLGYTRLTLSSDETLRRDRFLQTDDQLRFLAAHGLKRLVLAQCLECRASDLTFETNSFGKPQLHGNPLQFNISHAGLWVALVLDRNHEVGVDVESDRDYDLWRDVMPAITSDKDDKMTPVRLWTAKEALLKANGTGFSVDPRIVKVTAKGSEFVGQSDSFEAKGAWLAIDDRYVIAVAGGSGNYDWRIARTRNALGALIDGL